jgi:hypothetical protein
VHGPRQQAIRIAGVKEWASRSARQPLAETDVFLDARVRRHGRSRLTTAADEDHHLTTAYHGGATESPAWVGGQAAVVSRPAAEVTDEIVR